MSHSRTYCVFENQTTIEVSIFYKKNQNNIARVDICKLRFLLIN